MKGILTALSLVGFMMAAAPAVQAKSASEGQEAKPAAKDAAKAAPKAAAAPKVFTSPQKEGTKATCPVTGEEFVIEKDTQHAEYKGKHVYFCCPGCKGKFDKDPEKFTK
jgi:YHS domain-containing protein